MDSLIKQINFRVKGTEMLWGDPEGAEAILHIRSALLSEDDRFDNYLSNRPGWQLQRRTTQQLPHRLNWSQLLAPLLRNSSK